MRVISEKLAVILSVTLLSGCSTMYNSGSQSIVASTTNGKQVNAFITTPSGSYMAKLPTTIVAEPSTFSDVTIEIKDDCYDPSSMQVNKGVTPSYWANIFNGWGFIIDPFTGTMWKYSNLASIPVNEKKDKPSHCKSSDAA